MLKKEKTDLEPTELNSVTWGSDTVLESLDGIHKLAIKKADDAITWYLFARRSKKRWASCLRLFIIIAGSFAGILPILSQILINNNGKPFIAPAWASVFLGVAGAMLALDRFFGFSSGWIRYIAAELRLHQLLEEFQLDWQKEKINWKNETPDNKQVLKMLDMAKSFITQVNEVVIKETNDWINEFQSTLKNIEGLISTNRENK